LTILKGCFILWENHEGTKEKNYIIPSDSASHTDSPETQPLISLQDSSRSCKNDHFMIHKGAEHLDNDIILPWHDSSKMHVDAVGMCVNQVQFSVFWQRIKHSELQIIIALVMKHISDWNLFALYLVSIEMAVSRTTPLHSPLAKQTGSGISHSRSPLIHPLC